MTWNFDMTSAPRGRHVTQTRIIKGEPQQYDVFIMERVLLAHPTDGKVYATYWIEPNKFTPNGRWSGWCEGVEPLAWMPYPIHPFHQSDVGEFAAVKGEARLANAAGVEPSTSGHFILDDCGSGA